MSWMDPPALGLALPRRVTTYTNGVGLHSFLELGGIVRATVVGGGENGLAGIYDYGPAAGQYIPGGTGGSAGETVQLIYRPQSPVAQYTVGAVGGNSVFDTILAQRGASGGIVTIYQGYNESPKPSKILAGSTAGGAGGFGGNATGIGNYKGSAPGYPLFTMNSHISPYFAILCAGNGVSLAGTSVSRTASYGGNGSEFVIGGGGGGDSLFGRGGDGGNAGAAGGKGGNAEGYGAGGGGGGSSSSNNSGNAGALGLGTGGLIIIEEF